MVICNSGCRNNVSDEAYIGEKGCGLPTMPTSRSASAYIHTVRQPTMRAVAVLRMY